MTRKVYRYLNYNFFKLILDDKLNTDGITLSDQAEVKLENILKINIEARLFQNIIEQGKYLRI